MFRSERFSLADRLLDRRRADAAGAAGKVKTFSIGFDIPGYQRSALCGRGGPSS